MQTYRAELLDRALIWNRRITAPDIRRCDRLGGIAHEYRHAA